MKPKISVVMPVHNGEHYLSEAIDSILCQTEQDLELIVIDDGSTDRTHEILAGYAVRDHRVRIISIGRSGIVRALNAGLCEARGTYIARMDADDVSHPDRLKLQSELLDRRTSTVACGTNYVLFGARNRTVIMPRSDGQCRALLLIQSCFAHPSVMLRGEVLRREGIVYREDFRLAEDYALWCELAKFGELHNIQRPLLRYRVHPSQSSVEKIRQQHEVHLRIALSNLAGVGIEENGGTLAMLLWPQLQDQNSLSYLLGSLRALPRYARAAPGEQQYLFRHLVEHILRNTAAMTARRLCGLRCFSL